MFDDFTAVKRGQNNIIVASIFLPLILSFFCNFSFVYFDSTGYASLNGFLDYYNKKTTFINKTRCFKSIKIKTSLNLKVGISFAERGTKNFRKSTMDRNHGSPATLTWKSWLPWKSLAQSDKAALSSSAKLTFPCKSTWISIGMVRVLRQSMPCFGFLLM